MISKNNFLDTFHSLFDETPTDQISISTKYKTLEEWSSLTLLSLMVLFEEEYQVKLTPQDIEHTTTVEDLYNLIEKKQAF